MRGLLPFLHVAGKLKHVRRSGWIRSGVPGVVESVAEHSWRVAVMAMSFEEGPHDTQRAVRMSVLHDIQEALVGDIMPPEHSGVAVDDKHRMEQEAVHKLAQMVPEEEAPTLKRELEELFKEYEEGKTETAKFVKDLDKAEMLVQALEYEKQHPDVNLQDFFDTTVSRLRTNHVKKFIEAVVQEREQLHKSRQNK